MISLLLAARTDLVELGMRAPAARRVLYAAGLLLIVSGFLHVAVYLDRGGDWEGALSWRKPILFGFSGGLTTLSIGWALGLVTASPGLRKAPWTGLPGQAHSWIR